MKSFTVEGHEFVADGIAAYRHAFHGFRIRVCKQSSDGTWCAELATASNTHWHPSNFTSAMSAARGAMAYWKDDIEESDRLDAEDSDRERRDFEREHKLTTKDVL